MNSRNGKISHLIFLNGEEHISVDEIKLVGDSIQLRMPIFDSEFHFQVKGKSMTGTFFNHARKNHNQIPFSASLVSDMLRFEKDYKGAPKNFDGKWEVDFLYQEKDSSKAIGIFKQSGNQLAGTFITPTGDYRYLQGEANGDSMFLSCFDGAHAFLFEAGMNDDGKLSGSFWSGDHWIESWTAVRNETFELPSADSLTYLKAGYESLAFKFPNLDGDTIDLEAFKGKVTLIQIMGSWCPNCRDETEYFCHLYEKYTVDDFEIVALAFEMTSDFEKARNNLLRLKEHFSVPYEILFAGKAGKGASESLPMLNNIMSYPTTILVDKEGRIDRIITGFTGPATGKRFTDFTTDLENSIDKLLANP